MGLGKGDGERVGEEFGDRLCEGVGEAIVVGGLTPPCGVISRMACPFFVYLTFALTFAVLPTSDCTLCLRMTMNIHMYNNYTYRSSFASFS